jgi:hypothetical protein
MSSVSVMSCRAVIRLSWFLLVLRKGFPFNQLGSMLPTRILNAAPGVLHGFCLGENIAQRQQYERRGEMPRAADYMRHRGYRAAARFAVFFVAAARPLDW